LNEFLSKRWFFGVDFSAYRGQMMKEIALTSFTLYMYDAYRTFAPRTQ